MKTTQPLIVRWQHFSRRLTAVNTSNDSGFGQNFLNFKVYVENFNAFKKVIRKFQLNWKFHKRKQCIHKLSLSKIRPKFKTYTVGVIMDVALLSRRDV